MDKRRRQVLFVEISRTMHNDQKLLENDEIQISIHIMLEDEVISG